MQIVTDPSISRSSILAETPYVPAPTHQGEASNGPSSSSPEVPGGLQTPEQRSNGVTLSTRDEGIEKSKEEGASELKKSPTLELAVHSPGLSQSFPGTGGYLANRWNASTLSTPSSVPHDDSLRYATSYRARSETRN